MELSPEERARIIGEEQRRLAEERYREEVRQHLRGQHASPPSPSFPRPPPQRRPEPAWKVVVLVVLVVILGVLVLGRIRPDLVGSTIKELTCSPLDFNSFTVPPLSSTVFSFTMLKERSLDATFMIEGGNGDVFISLTDANDRPVLVLGMVQRKARLSRTLFPGGYRIHFTNVHSVFTGKTITGEVKVCGF